MSPLRRVAVVLCCLLASRSARAALVFTIDHAQLTPGVGEQVIARIAPQLAQQGLGPDLEQQLEAALAPTLQQLQDNINGKLGGLNFTPFVRAMSSAAAASANILPLDHAGEPSFLSLGAALGGGLNARGALSTHSLMAGLASGTVPEIGVGAALSLSLGMRLELLHLRPWGVIDFDRLTLEVTAMAVDLARAANGLHPGLVPHLSAPYLHLGLHGQYALLRGRSILPGGLLRWGGLQVGSGLHFSRLAVSFASALPGGTLGQQFTWQGAQAGLQAAWDGSATIRADLHTLTIPVQAATSLQVLYLVTLFGGVAAELNIGSGSLTIDGDEPARVSIVPQSGDPLQVAAPHAHFGAGAVARPALGDLRGFAGAQLNLWALALQAQASADTARNVAVALGARLFW